MKIKLRASGSLPPPDMKPGEYVARCERGEVKVRGNKVTVMLTFSVLGKIINERFDPMCAGVALCQWYAMGEVEPGNDAVTLEVKPFSKYGQAWAKAMGRPMGQNDDPAPNAFRGKSFKVEVGYRSDLDKNYSYRNQGYKKNEKDFLRIHLIVEKIEQKALTHMTPLSHMIHMHPYNNDIEHTTEASSMSRSRSRSRSRQDFSDSSSSSEKIGSVKTDFRVDSMTNERTDVRHTKTSGGEVEPLPCANGLPPAGESSTTDDGGFDWDVGTQDSGKVEYMAVNGEIKYAGSVNEAWVEIKREHAARRARGQ